MVRKPLTDRYGTTGEAAAAGQHDWSVQPGERRRKRQSRKELGRQSILGGVQPVA